MSDTTASLRRKINSAGDLQSVVRTMKALAASSIGQYEQSVRALADYYRTWSWGWARVSGAPVQAPLMTGTGQDKPDAQRDWCGRVRFRPGIGGPV
jgi:F0F1-type ATP synthase gamma subunit